MGRHAEALRKAGGEVGDTLRTLLTHPSVTSLPGGAAGLVTRVMGPSRMTCLMIAAARGYGPAVTEVLRAAAGGELGPDSADQLSTLSELEAMQASSGQTALHMAVAMCDAPTVSALLAPTPAGAPPAPGAASPVPAEAASAGGVGSAGAEEVCVMSEVDMAGLLPGVVGAVKATAATVLEDYSGLTPVDLGYENLLVR